MTVPQSMQQTRTVLLTLGPNRLDNVVDQGWRDVLRKTKRRRRSPSPAKKSKPGKKKRFSPRLAAGGGGAAAQPSDSGEDS